MIDRRDLLKVSSVAAATAIMEGANLMANGAPLATDYAGVREYIGARYVPLFANPLEWSNQREYEPLTIVVWQGNSYTSTQYVPTGIDIGNTEFWALTGNYNAQVEGYRQEVQHYVEEVQGYSDQIENANTNANEAKATASDAMESIQRANPVAFNQTHFTNIPATSSYQDIQAFYFPNTNTCVLSFYLYFDTPYQLPATNVTIFKLPADLVPIFAGKTFYASIQRWYRGSSNEISDTLVLGDLNISADGTVTTPTNVNSNQYGANRMRGILVMTAAGLNAV